MNSVIRKIVVAIAAAAAINIAAVVFLRGNFVHFLVVLGSLVFVAAPLFVVSIGVMLWAGMKRPESMGTGVTLNLAGVVAGSLLISAIIGLTLAKADVRAAKRYCESLVPRIEAYRVEHGDYPERVEEVEYRRGKRPRLLAEGDFYRREAGSYLFELPEPQGPASYWVFYGELKSWQKD